MFMACQWLASFGFPRNPTIGTFMNSPYYGTDGVPEAYRVSSLYGRMCRVFHGVFTLEVWHQWNHQGECCRPGRAEWAEEMVRYH